MYKIQSTEQGNQSFSNLQLENNLYFLNSRENQYSLTLLSERVRRAKEVFCTFREVDYFIIS